jgi:hypothetical protein
VSKAVTNLPSRFDNLSAGDLADEHGTLGVQIAELEARRKAIGAELLHRGVCEIDGSRFHAVAIAETMTATINRKAIEKAMGEAWLARFLKWSKRSAHVKTTALPAAAAARLAA